MKIKVKNAAGAFWLCLFLISLYYTSTHNYLLFHVIVESLSIFIAFLLFFIALNIRPFLKNDYLPFLGFVFPFIGTIDFIHTLAFEGMGVFPEYGANLATQLWIQARYLQSVSFAVAPIFLVRKVRLSPVLSVYGTVTVLLLLSIFTFDIFPDCFREDSGLTPFKIYSEYAICLILGISLVLLIFKRDYFSKLKFIYIVLAIVSTITSELSFTLYIDVYGLANMTGHILKMLSFYFFYKGLVETGLKEPYNGLFTNLQRSEEDLLLAQSELRRKNEELSSFIYAAGHDLRTPLTSARGYVLFLKKKLSGSISSEDREILDTVLSSLTHLSTMIKDLLDYAYLGEKSRERKPVNLESIINGLVMEKREEIAKLGVEIKVHDDLPLLHMSETRVYQVFANLISNSLKFFKEGVEPFVEIGIAKGDDLEGPGNQEWLFVRDNGIGMTREVRDRAFDMFYTSNNKDNTGTGAGLAIVRRIVESEKGSINIESKPGEGTTFYFQLPVFKTGETEVNDLL